MQSTVVVPLDGSELAERALPYAVRLARASNARLLLLRAVLAHPPAGVPLAEARAAVVERAQCELGTVAERLRLQKAGLVVEPVVEYAEASDAIVESVRKRQAGLIVMATLGRTGIGRMLYGSVADRVLRRAEVPVLLVPATCQRPWGGGQPFRILVPLDGSAFAEEVLGPATELAALQATELVLVRAVPRQSGAASTESTYGSVIHDVVELAAAQEYLQKVVARISRPGTSIVAQAIYGEPAVAISDLARRQDADLIALATHGRGGLARMVMGSTATELLQRAHTPLLLMRPGDVQQSSATATTSAGAEAIQPEVSVTLNRPELDLVRAGLEELLREAELEAGARVRDAAGARAVSDLLARLKQAERVDVGKDG